MDGVAVWVRSTNCYSPQTPQNPIPLHLEALTCHVIPVGCLNRTRKKYIKKLHIFGKKFFFLNLLSDLLDMHTCVYGPRSNPCGTPSIIGLHTCLFTYVSHVIRCNKTKKQCNAKKNLNTFLTYIFLLRLYEFNIQMVIKIHTIVIYLYYIIRFIYLDFIIP